ncbi:uncharacterized protein [Euphorbia lathyris]|uniref:uncharacterized protein n=1 Tax=Euphorbia lathyris TaxID=212925 RepID=UPI0033135B5C
MRERFEMLKVELKDSLADELVRKMRSEFSESNRRERVELKEELRAELKVELKEELRAELKDELKEELMAELRDVSKADRMGERLGCDMYMNFDFVGEIGGDVGEANVVEEHGAEHSEEEKKNEDRDRKEDRSGVDKKEEGERKEE